jgi:5-methylcytosine-specific restriction endonuclease McrA
MSPLAAARPCRTCGTLRCTTHVRKAWDEKATTTKRTIVGRGLQAARQALYIKQGGQCKQCGRLVTPGGMVRDHIIGLAEGGVDTASNTQGLCLPCNEMKRQAEARRGQQRWR